MVWRDISLKGYEDLFCISLKNKSSLLFPAGARIKRKISQEVSGESNGLSAVVHMCFEIADYLKNICKYNHACP